MNLTQTQHIPVMLEEVMQLLQPHAGGQYIDATLGGGGHTSAILARSAPTGKVLGVDTDVQALARVKERLSYYVSEGRLLLTHGNFSDLSQIVEQAGLTSVQGILLDLGFSSDQMDTPERGFAFSTDGPLDMRLNQSLATTAADLVNEADEAELADIFWKYGEERRSRQIARRIVNQRAKGAITRTKQLADLVAAGVPYKPGAIHPATRVFQALRIAVNQELERLEAVLPQILEILSKKRADGGRREEAGRMAIIAFHSLEDRIVKEFMRREATDCLCPPHVPVCVCGHKARLRLLTPKPRMPGAQEIERNPRARSARLRAAEVVVE
ncbi:16S rRNA (cytosine(1402)-N(4))-methyltransferase RsmH [Ktedonosporobacter rubrisoli]|uniref:Ribosomal RNA small subunit methyltransferase H n=1 Tax=Ktedonosporobacter rubrisoli TaxID=2509675 RepID=A0A4P6JZE8_KTERU|nr:16S rRNA (cytosine(1402)-N(4))-methyltransferase RsmH [Ktedonosporobacter rubrisoli]QBD81187.1 16S rRNA (cytosine(1402)-N(4))-methyltransferase RsmH [Ktedonosporobacter rubrisoli]